MAELKFQTIHLDEIPQGVRVKLGGIIDVTTADTFRATLLTLLSVGFRRIMLDFKEVQFVNSTGFANMVEVSQHLRETGGVVVLSELRPEVKDICVDLGLDTFFSLADSDEEAFKVLVESQVRPVDDLEDDHGDAAEFYIGPDEDMQGDGSEWNSGELIRGEGDEDANATTTPTAPVSPFAQGAQLEVDDALELDFRASSDNVNIFELIGSVESASSSSAGSLSTHDADVVQDSEQEDFQPAGADVLEEQPLEVLDPLAPVEPVAAVDPLAPVAAVEPVESVEPVAATEPVESVPAEAEVTAVEAAEMLEEAAAEAAAAQSNAASPTPIDTPSAQELRLPISRDRSARKATEKLIRDANETDAVRDRESADHSRAAAMITQLPKRSAKSATNATTSRVSRRERNLKAMATLLASIPSESRLWRKLLVYISKDAQTQAPSLNLVLAKLPNNRATPDAFLLTESNPYVTIVPKVPNGVAIPERLAVDVTKGGDEITFKIQPERSPNRPGAVTGKPRLEVWYGPTLIRTIRMPDPFESQ